MNKKKISIHGFNDTLTVLDLSLGDPPMDEEHALPEDELVFVWIDTGDVFRFESSESDHVWKASHHVVSGNCTVTIENKAWPEESRSTDIVTVEGYFSTLSILVSWPVTFEYISAICNHCMKEFDAEDYPVKDQIEIIKLLSGMVIPWEDKGNAGA